MVFIPEPSTFTFSVVIAGMLGFHRRRGEQIANPIAHHFALNVSLMIQKAFFTGILTVALASTANASVIFMPVFDPVTTAGGGTSTAPVPGTWQLFAVDDSDADFGISGYNITYGPAVTAINHRTPNGIATDGNGDDQSAGFSLLRSGTNINPMVASQGLPGTTPFLITGLGQIQARWRPRLRRLILPERLPPRRQPTGAPTQGQN